MQKTVSITAGVLALAAIFSTAPAHADAPEDVVCQILDKHGASPAIFNGLAASVRESGASSSDFRMFMYDQLSLCPSYRRAYYRWQSGI
jgi:hypothetical protein